MRTGRWAQAAEAANHLRARGWTGRSLGRCGSTPYCYELAKSDTMTGPSRVFLDNPFAEGWTAYSGSETAWPNNGTCDFLYFLTDRLTEGRHRKGIPRSAECSAWGESSPDRRYVYTARGRDLPGTEGNTRTPKGRLYAAIQAGYNHREASERQIIALSNKGLWSKAHNDHTVLPRFFHGDPTDPGWKSCMNKAVGKAVHCRSKADRNNGGWRWTGM